MSWRDAFTILLLSQYVTACFVAGFRTLSLKDKILEPLRLRLEAHIGLFWSKPLMSCAPCMASFWGTIIYTLVVWAYFYSNCTDLNYLYLALLYPVAVVSSIPVIVFLYKPPK